MAKYIDKDAIVAEIERKIKAIPKGETDKRLRAVYGNEAFVLNDLLSFLNTLEVKEIDLQSEIDRVWDNTSDNFLEDGWKEFEDIAKHFSELGMAVSNKAQKGEKV